MKKASFLKGEAMNPEDMNLEQLNEAIVIWEEEQRVTREHGNHVYRQLVRLHIARGELLISNGVVAQPE